MTYAKNGKYDESKNSQAEKTFSAILVIGDARRLDFHLYKQGFIIVKVIKEEGRHFLVRTWDSLSASSRR